MANIAKAVSSAFDSTKDYRIDYNIVEQGSPALLTGIYPTTSDIVADFYKKPDITSSDGTTKTSKIYGEVLITPSIVDSGVTNSTNDPASIIKTIRFIMGNGPQEGIVPGPTGNQLENVYLINPNSVPTPVVNSSGVPTTGDVVLAATLGGVITSAPKIWDAIKSSAPASAKAPAINPVTGQPIPSTSAINQTNASKGVLLDTLGNVNTQGKGQYYVPAWDPTTNNWIAKSPNELVGLAIPGGTICGGAGGMGGTGGTGGSGGSSSSGSFNASSSIPAETVSQTSFVNGHNIEYGYYDKSGTSISLGTVTASQYRDSSGTLNVSLIGPIIQPDYVASIGNTSVSVSVNTSMQITLFATSIAGCGVSDSYKGWLKDAGTLITSTPATLPCGPCYVKSPSLQLRNSNAASTANLSGTTAIITRNTTQPTITAVFDRYSDLTSSGPIYYLTHYNVGSGGSGFYVAPKIHYDVSTGLPGYRPSNLIADTTTVSGGSVTSATVANGNINNFKYAGIPTAFNNRWSKICYGNSLFVTLSTNSNIAISSSNGTTWVSSTLPSSANWTDVAWNGSVFCAVGGGYADGQYPSFSGTSQATVATSSNGTTWTSHAITSGKYTSISAMGSRFVAIDASGNTQTSTDGITWTSGTLPGSANWTSVTNNGTTFVAVNNNSLFAATSTNGSTWTSRTITNGGWVSIAWNGTTFCTVGGSGANSTSSTGTTWTAGTSFTTNFPYVISSDGSKFLSIDNSGIVWSSTNGSSWSNLTTIPRPYLTSATYSTMGLAYGASTWVSFSILNAATISATTGNTGTTWYPGVYPMTSSTGASWTKNTAMGIPTSQSESIPNGIGYDPTITTTYFDVPQKTKQLTLSSPLTTLDGVTLANGNMILLKDQTDATQNGLYERISSTVYNLAYELCSMDYTSNGLWTLVTAGTVNNAKDFMLNSTTSTIYSFVTPQTWQDVTASTACDITPGGGGGGGSGSAGSPGSAGAAGSCVTVNTTAVLSPTLALANPCTTTFGATDPVTGNFTAVAIPKLATLVSNCTPDTVTLLYSVTLGDGFFAVSGTLPGTVTATIATRSISLAGPTADVLTASGQILFTPPLTQKTDVTYQVLVTGATGLKASQVCGINPQSLVNKTNAAACSSLTITAAAGSDTAKVQIKSGTSTVFNFSTAKDLTNGYVPFNTSFTQTAADIVTNINANIAVKNALATTDANWLPLYTASSSGPVIKVCAPSAGGADFNGITLTSATTGTFAFSGSSPMLGGITSNVSDLLNKIPHWDAISSVLAAVGGSVAGAVVSNIIMNKSSSVQISIPDTTDTTVAFLYRGSKIKVPNEYTSPFSSQQTGEIRSGHPTYAAFSGVYKTVYSNNPAWVVYDFIKNQREGLGTYLPLTSAQETLLLQDIFKIALYCDEQVLRANGTTYGNRFNTNTVISSGSRMQVLEQLCSVFFGGYAYWNGGLRITADMPDSNVVLLVNQENCNSVVEQLTSVGTFVNKVQVTYVEPNNFFNNEVVVAEKNAAIAVWGEKLSQVTMFACTDSDEAIRYANWILNSQIQNAQVFTYNAGLDHYNLVPGQLVQYENPIERGVRYSGRVKSVSGVNVVLDAPIANIVGDAFAVTNNDGSIFNTTISAISGANLTMAAASPGTIDPWATFIASDSVIGKRLYKALKSDETGLGQYSISLQYYSPSKFTISTASSVPFVPAALVVSDQASTYIKLHWEASTQTTGPGIAGYYIYRNGNTTTPYATLGNVLTYTDSGVTAGTKYTYQVAAFSADTTAIISLPSPVTATFTRIGKWISVIGGSTTAQSSSNGISWSAITLPSSLTWLPPISSNVTALSFAASSSTYLSSTNGTTWTSNTFPFAAGSSIPMAYAQLAAAGAGQFVVLGRNNTNAAYSANGTSWTTVTLPTNGAWRTPVWGNSCWTTINRGGLNQYGMTSLDGITWTLRTLPSTQAWSEIAYGNGVFCTVTTIGGGATLSTVDGSVWTTGALPTITASWGSPVFYKNKFTVLSIDTAIGAYSTDGNTWTGITLPSAKAWSTPVYGNGVFVSVDQTSASTSYIHSTDGITWTAGTMPSSQVMLNPSFANGQFVVATTGAVSFSSPDGTTWTSNTISTSGNYTQAKYI